MVKKTYKSFSSHVEDRLRRRLKWSGRRDLLVLKQEKRVVTTTVEREKSVTGGETPRESDPNITWIKSPGRALRRKRVRSRRGIAKIMAKMRSSRKPRVGGLAGWATTSQVLLAQQGYIAAKQNFLLKTGKNWEESGSQRGWSEARPQKKTPTRPTEAPCSLDRNPFVRSVNEEIWRERGKESGKDASL